MTERHHHPVAPAVLALCSMLLVTCATELPSTTPLGKGPLAGTTQQGAARVASPRPTASSSSDGGSNASESLAESVVHATSDAGVDGPAVSASTGSTKPSSAAGVAVTVDSFAGEYRGRDSANWRFPNVPQRTDDDSNARLTVAKKSSSVLTFTPYYTESGKPVCTLEGTLEGASVKIGPGQACFEEGPMRASVQSGTARLSGNQLVLEVELKVTIEAEDQTMDGELGYRFEGTRR